MTAAPSPDPAAERPALLEGAVAAARRGGMREVWWRTLGVTVFRRLTVHTRALSRPSPGRTPPGVVLGEVEDAATYRGLRPALLASGFDARRARGDRCAGAWLDGRLVAVRWMALGVARLDYLDLEATLQPGVAYLYDAFTEPAVQGRGIGLALSCEVDRRLREAGAHRFFGAILAENRSGMALARSSPELERTGWIGVVRAGRRRVPVDRTSGALVAGLEPIARRAR